MREIKFRGINNETGEFVYGWYTRMREGARNFDAIIVDGDEDFVRYYIHNKETIGQFTGLLDRNGVEIYEGDIIRWDGSIIGVVSFSCCEFIIGIGNHARAMCALRDGQSEEELEVIGSIYQNPELLEGV